MDCIDKRNCFVQITNLKARGMPFMSIPDTYYDNLRAKLKDAKITVAEDIAVVRILCCVK